MSLDPGGHLTAHFTLAELTSTSHADLRERNREEAEPFLPALAAVASMLERVRAQFGRPIAVHSGFRGPSLNARVGGSATSQHLRGEAADFSTPGLPLSDVWDWIVDLSGLPYGQCLLEGPPGGVATWIHLSLGEPWRKRDRCREAGSNASGRVVLTMRDGKPIKVA